MEWRQAHSETPKLSWGIRNPQTSQRVTDSAKGRPNRGRHFVTAGTLVRSLSYELLEYITMNISRCRPTRGKEDEQCDHFPLPFSYPDVSFLPPGGTTWKGIVSLEN